MLHGCLWTSQQCSRLDLLDLFCSWHDKDDQSNSESAITCCTVHHHRHHAYLCISPPFFLEVTLTSAQALWSCKARLRDLQTVPPHGVRGCHHRDIIAWPAPMRNAGEDVHGNWNLADIPCSPPEIRRCTQDLEGGGRAERRGGRGGGWKKERRQGELSREISACEGYLDLIGNYLPLLSFVLSDKDINYSKHNKTNDGQTYSC